MSIFLELFPYSGNASRSLSFFLLFLAWVLCLSFSFLTADVKNKAWRRWSSTWNEFPNHYFSTVHSGQMAKLALDKGCCQAFLDNFPPTQHNWSCRDWGYFWNFGLSFFFMILLEFWFFHFSSFWEYIRISKRVPIFSYFWKYLMIKMFILGVPLSFPLKNEVAIQFSANGTQL